MLRGLQVTLNELSLPPRANTETSYDTTRPSPSLTLEQRSASPQTSATPPASKAMSPGPIAAITVGSLVGALLAFFVIGTIINSFYMRKRTEETRRIEAQHQRWPDLEQNYAPVDYFTHTTPYFQPPVEKPPMNDYSSPRLFKPEAAIQPAKVGGTLSPLAATTESPESYQSESSVSRLLQHPEPAMVSNTSSQQVAAQRPRPESCSTIFSEDEEGPHETRPGSRIAIVNQPSIGSSVRPSPGFVAPARVPRPAPAKLQIPVDRSAPPPIIISPPTLVSKPSTPQPTLRRVQKFQQQNTPSRSTSSTPPSYENFPAPPQQTNVTPSATSKKPTPNLQKQLPPVQPAPSRKPTPSYLPTYYTDPTPPAPFQLAPRSPYLPPRSTPPPNKVGPSKPLSKFNRQVDRPSDSCDSVYTSFESTKTEDITPSEDESAYAKPLAVHSGSQLKDFRYPKVPRSSNQRVPRSPLMNHQTSHSRNISASSNATLGSPGDPGLSQKRRGQRTANELDNSPAIRGPRGQQRSSPAPYQPVTRPYDQRRQPVQHQGPPPQMHWPDRMSSNGTTGSLTPRRQPMLGEGEMQQGLHNPSPSFDFL